jgi:hypothetical protein
MGVEPGAGGAEPLLIRVDHLRLDSYEQELALEASWVGTDKAIAINQRVLAGGSARTWVTRETRVLLALRNAG